MEASTIAAILLGSVIGGLLSDWSIILALAVFVRQCMLWLYWLTF